MRWRQYPTLPARQRGVALIMAVLIVALATILAVNVTFRGMVDQLSERLTSEGVPGMVHVDETTYRRLMGRFEFKEPQIIHLKGKGNTPVYQIVGPRQAAAALS